MKEDSEDKEDRQQDEPASASEEQTRPPAKRKKKGEEVPATPVPPQEVRKAFSLFNRMPPEVKASLFMQHISSDLHKVLGPSQIDNYITLLKQSDDHSYEYLVHSSTLRDKFGRFLVNRVFLSAVVGFLLVVGAIVLFSRLQIPYEWLVHVALAMFGGGGLAVVLGALIRRFAGGQSSEEEVDEE